jgi:cytochrome c
MKKTVLIVFLCITVAVSVVAQEKKEGMKEEAKKAKGEMADAHKELMAAVERGKALFADPALGTTGMSCGSCHMEGGTKPGKMGDMEIKPFMNVAVSYPKYVGMAGKVITLDQIVNVCIMKPMKGTPLKWDDQRLADLSAYVASVKPGKAE